MDSFHPHQALCGQAGSGPEYGVAVDYENEVLVVTLRSFGGHF